MFTYNLHIIRMYVYICSAVIVVVFSANRVDFVPEHLFRALGLKRYNDYIKYQIRSKSNNINNIAF